MLDSTRDDHGLNPVSTGQRAAVVFWTDDVRSAYAELADPDGNPVQMCSPCQPDGIPSWSGDVVARVREVTP